MPSTVGETRSDGFAVIVRPADLCPPWPNYSAPIPADCGSSLAVVAVRAGDFGELGVPSAKVRTIINSLPWRLKEKNIFALITANPAAAISKLMMDRGARP